jgi:ribosomal protein S18 acetylase RimI-like enzyme
MALEAGAFTHGWSEASWTDELERQCVGVTGDGDGVVAMSCVADVAEVRRVIVAPAARRQGLGRTLTEWGLAWAAGEGAAEAFLEVSATNEPALALYRALGFQPVDKRRDYYGPGDDAWVYRRVIGAAKGELWQNH